MKKKSEIKNFVVNSFVPPAEYYPDAGIEIKILKIDGSKRCFQFGNCDDVDSLIASFLSYKEQNGHFIDWVKYFENQDFLIEQFFEPEMIDLIINHRDELEEKIGHVEFPKNPFVEKINVPYKVFGHEDDLSDIDDRNAVASEITNNEQENDKTRDEVR